MGLIPKDQIPQGISGTVLHSCGNGSDPLSSITGWDGDGGASSSLSAVLGSLSVFSGFSKVYRIPNSQNHFAKDLQDHQIQPLDPAIPMKPNCLMYWFFGDSTFLWGNPLPVLNHCQWKGFTNLCERIFTTLSERIFSTLSEKIFPCFQIPEKFWVESPNPSCWDKCLFWDVHGCAHQALPPLNEKPWIKNSNQVISGLNDHLENLGKPETGVCSHEFQPCHNRGKFQKQGGIIFLPSMPS